MLAETHRHGSRRYAKRFGAMAVGALMSISIGLATAAPAGAANHNYCGPPNLVYYSSPCWSGAYETYDYNQAFYGGQTFFTFCERLTNRNFNYFYSYNCRDSPGTVKGYASDSGDIILPNNSVFLADLIVNATNDGKGHGIGGYSTW